LGVEGDAGQSSVTGLAQTAHAFAPTEDAFDAAPDVLAAPISFRAQRAPVEPGNVAVAERGDVRKDVMGPAPNQWACSDKQRDLILKIVDEHKLDKQEVEGLAKDMFQTPVKALNKMQASGLIEELLEKYGPKKTNGDGQRSYQRGRR
jgi:hypothetical protein